MLNTGNTPRPDKTFYYLDIARATCARSTCLNKRWGAVIVKDDEIISTGYNGSPRGRKNCCDIGECYRIKNNIPRGTHYESCRSIHAEANAIISAARHDMMHGVMYIYGWDVVHNCIVPKPDSCMMCKRMIINADITEVIFADPEGFHFDNRYGYGYRSQHVQQWVEDDDMPVYGQGY